MKRNLFLLLSLLLIISACGTSDEPEAETSTLAIFLVDYSDNSLEGAATVTVAKVPLNFTELPLTTVISEPNNGLDGSARVTFTPTGDLLFDGEISEEGNSRVFAPQFIDESNFAMLDQPLSLPNNLVIEDIEGPYNEPFQPIWEAIDEFSIVEVFLNQGGLFGRFLYQPSEAVPNEWKWVVIILNQ